MSNPSSPVSPRQLSVFLCHASENKPMVRDLYRKLKEYNVAPWLDEEELIGGQDWDLEIQKAVRKCDVVLVCLSPAFLVKEGYGQREIKLALDTALEKPEGANYLIPLKLENCQLPERLRRFHAINYFAENGFDRLIKALQYRVESKNASLHAGIAPIHYRASRKLTPTRSKAPIVSNPPIGVATSQGIITRHSGSRCSLEKSLPAILATLALVSIVIAAVVLSHVFNLFSGVHPPKATSTPVNTPTAPTWLVQPTATFGAVVPDHEFKEPVYPGQILSLSTEVGQFTALDANNHPTTYQLSPQAGKSYVIVVMGDQTGSVPVTLDVTGVSSGHIDWEIRIPPAGTQLLAASIAVEKRVASGLKMKPNCAGNGCTTVGYYILDSGMHIVQTSEPQLITIPSNTQYGVSFIAPTNGMYRITFEGGAYTTYQGSSWVTEIVIYKDKPIQWSNTQQPGPTAFDTYIGSGHKEDSATAAINDAIRDKPTVNFSLQQGDRLLFVAVDVEGEYLDNMGQIVLSIELIQ